MNRFLNRIGCLGFVMFIAAGGAPAQSSDQAFPTAVTTNEISGEIKPRDIGDARLTTYYYAFDGTTGDVVINVSTKNFNGNIDVFTLPSLQPLAKVVVFADLPEPGISRAFYLRKPEKLLLRIQGRSPNDSPSAFTIKFDGSFVAASGETDVSAPPSPKVPVIAGGKVQVNSVGTIISEPSTARPADEAAARVDNNREKDAGEPEPAARPAKTVAKPKVVITRPVKPVPTIKLPPSRPRPARSPNRRAAERRNATAKPPTPAAPDPLANIKLVISFKDGRVIERPMNEVFRFSVDKGVLTIVERSGTIGRYSLLDIDKVTIQ